MSSTPHPSGASPKPWKTTEKVRHSKEDALSDRQFERMVESTYKLDCDYFALECRFVLFAAGRLGMRGGEIAHMREEWIDWGRGMIVVPRHEPCTDGRDGGICGHCRQSAQQIVDHNPTVTTEEAEAAMWSPKTENAAREIPFDATTRAQLAVEEYFDRFDSFQASRGVVNRRVTRMAEQADGVDPETTYPHCLRATAASYFSARGLDAVALKSFFGWSEFSTALNYIEESGERTAVALRGIRR